MAFSTAVRPGSHRKSCFLLCAGCCFVSKHTLGVGDGVCAGSRCMQLQIWVNELGKQEHRIQNVLKNEHKLSEGLISTIWKLEPLRCSSAEGTCQKVFPLSTSCVQRWQELEEVPPLRHAQQDGSFLMLNPSKSPSHCLCLISSSAAACEVTSPDR